MTGVGGLLFADVFDLGGGAVPSLVVVAGSDLAADRDGDLALRLTVLALDLIFNLLLVLALLLALASLLVFAAAFAFGAAFVLLFATMRAPLLL
jgi:hypothetical protein